MKQKMLRIVPLKNSKNKVFLDDLDVSAYIRKVDFALSSDEAIASLELIHGIGISIPDEIKTQLGIKELDV